MSLCMAVVPAHIRGEAILFLLLAAPVALICVLLTRLLLRVLQPISPIPLRIRTLKTHLFLWLLYSVLIVAFVLRNLVD